MKVVIVLSDTDTNSQIDSEILRVKKLVGIDQVVLDLIHINFLASSTIAKLIKLFKQCGRQNMQFNVINAGQMYTTFVSLNLQQMFKIEK